MAFSFNFYLDPALTTPITQRLAFVQADASPAPDNKVVWFGSPDPSVSCEAVSNPGVDAITVSVIDAVPGSGNSANDVRLALSAIGLESAAGGAPLALPVTLAGGVANALAIHIRVMDTTHSTGVSTDLGLTTNSLRQS